MDSIVEKIKKLKQEKNAIVLAHCYQNMEVDEVADFVGDSLYLSKMAKSTDADIIVFAGVSFMAETAKLLSPNKKVLLPRTESGCFMAEMIDLENLRKFKAKYPGIPTVCYINSTAAIKSECDVCCTSSNALDIVRNLNVPKVLFLPDTYLGKWVESKLDGVEVITYNGFCPTHLRIYPEDIENMRQTYPNAKILAHPECHTKVTELADFVGSTKAKMEYAARADNTEFVIATEKGVADRLTRDYPNKKFHLIKDSIVCQNMKWNKLEDIYNSLINETHEITLDETISKKAMKCINRMFEINDNSRLKV